MKKYFLVFLFPFIFISCIGSQSHENNDAPIPVRLSPAVLRDDPEILRGFGSLSYVKKFEVVSLLDGVLYVLHFREGERIRTGDLIAVLHNPQINLAARRAEDSYSQAIASLDIAQVRLRDSIYNAEMRILENEKSMDELAQAVLVLEEERRKIANREAIYEAGGISDEAIREERFRLAAMENQIVLLGRDLEIRRIGLRESDLAAAGMHVPEDREEFHRALIHLASMGARAEVDAARANLESAAREVEASRILERELYIRSPGPGIVGARYVEVGERIQREDRILTIIEDESLYAFFPVPESEAYKIQKGMTAYVTSVGDEVYSAVVDLVSPQADSQTFTFTVRVLLESGVNGSLRPGMFARVSIPLENDRQVLLVPESAFAFVRENTARVFTVNNNTLSERNVQIGSRHGEEREIISGLNPGELVVLNPGSSHREGVYVVPAN